MLFRSIFRATEGAEDGLSHLHGSVGTYLLDQEVQVFRDFGGETYQSHSVSYLSLVEVEERTNAEAELGMFFPLLPLGLNAYFLLGRSEI